MTHSILTLARDIKVPTKSGAKRFLIGLKIEESNRPLVPRDVIEKFLMEIGEIELVDAKNKIYGLKLETKGDMGEVQLRRLYRDLKPLNRSNNLYRTYDYLKARKSPVYKEPIKLSNSLKEALETRFEYEN
ncbi:uncharacterized protein METZ01_LOCUS344314 [marine metagenome]|uniref:Uncharacterized protein n=1 Tax=marine metagenome TaxID=408172 RepID=A0A382R2N2_9ZZZZ